MKRLGVAGIIKNHNGHYHHIVLGKRVDEPNKDMYVLPGGGLQEGETLEQAFIREIREETSLDVLPNPDRWKQPELIELPDRIILVAFALVESDYNICSGSDLYGVDWFDWRHLPDNVSPVVKPILATCGYLDI